VSHFEGKTHYCIQEEVFLTMRLFLSLLLLLTPAWGGAVYFDGTFNPADWDTVVRTQGAGVTHSATQEFAGGNPGEYLRFSSTYPETSEGTTRTYTADLFNPNFVWDPAADGPIGQIFYALDLLWTSNTGFGIPVGHFHRPTLRQGGVGYTLGDGSVAVTHTTPEWTTYTFNSTSASDWLQVGGSGNPDFSINGGLIEFGFRVSLGASCSGPPGSTCPASSAISGLDNLNIRISALEAGGPSEIPEPSTVALMGAGLFGVAYLRRRKSRA
jgi:hypothetical protein